ncbi:MAG: EF-hand domain-containing protein [Chthoniobacter sp.]|nr:EF-hand domain-containing protein [Chthoniobacter sp.]
MKRIITTLSALALASTLTFAEDQPAGPGGGHRGHGHGHPQPGEIFKKLDTNNDGSISEAEFKAGPRAQKDPAKAAEIFKKLDADNSGGVTAEELKAHRPEGGKGGPGCKHKGGKGGAAPTPA